MLKLYLVDIQGEDAGSYTCKATLEGNRVDKNVELDIFRKSPFFVFSIYSNYVMFNVGCVH